MNTDIAQSFIRLNPTLDFLQLSSSSLFVDFKQFFLKNFPPRENFFTYNYFLTQKINLKYCIRSKFILYTWMNLDIAQSFIRLNPTLDFLQLYSSSQFIAFKQYFIKNFPTRYDLGLFDVKTGMISRYVVKPNILA
jgi:hypothetical protein